MSLASQLTFSQLSYLLSLREQNLEREYLRMLRQPTQPILNLMSILRENLSQNDMIVEDNAISGTNCIVKLQRSKIGIIEFSILHTNYYTYEIAMKGRKGIIYKPELGFDSFLPNFDTIDELVQFIQKTYQKLCELQTEYNRKKRQRRKASYQP
jgi:hypothetical protein